MAGAVTLGYGLLLNTIVNFVIVAFALFLVVKTMNATRKREPPPPAAREGRSPAHKNSGSAGASLMLARRIGSRAGGVRRRPEHRRGRFRPVRLPATHAGQIVPPLARHTFTG